MVEKMQIEVKRVAIDELQEKGFADVAQDGQSRTLFSSAKLKAYQTNPTIQDLKECAHLAGLVDGSIAGGISPFSIRVVADEVIYRGVSASSLWVEPKYRNTGLAIDLLEEWQTLAHDKINIACGITRKARPIYHLMGFKIFTFQQVYWIRRSKGYLKNKFKGRVYVPGCFFLLDRLLDVYGLWIRCVGRVINAPWSVQRVLPNEHGKLVLVEEIVRQDTSRFREEHNAAWFKWLLENNFYGENQQQSLYLAYKSGVLVGFFMLLVLDNQQKNETWGRIIEWGCRAGFEKQEPRLLLQAFLTLNRDVDIACLECAQKESIRFLKRLGLFVYGNQVMVMKAQDDSPLVRHAGYDQQDNWRMRPANGDHGLS